MARAIREQPPRRSKRIAASRESSAAPSLASEEEEPEQQKQQQQRKEYQFSEDNALRRHMTFSRIPSPTPSPVAIVASSPVAVADETPVATPGTTTTTDPTTTPARPSLLRRALGFLSSPFGSHVTRPSPLPASSHPQQPLGELPASRKRQAPEPEQEPDPAPKPAIAVVTATPTRLKTPRGPSTMNRNHRSSLNAISERTESSSATSRAPEPTPSRHRTIASVRSKRDQALSTPARPRAWVRPPMPREPNADNRLAKLTHYNDLKERMQSLEKDEEIREMVSHRTKRVKIDDLVFIPHNRPGDPSSTFRVYDDDSDDEMEVDEALELRKNVFEEVTTEEVITEGLSPAKPSPAKPSPVKASPVKLSPAKPSPANQQEASPSKEQMRPAEVTPPKVPGSQYSFPNVKLRKAGDVYQDGTRQEARLGAIFKMAFEHWQRTGEILPVF